MSPVAWSDSGSSGHPVYGCILILVKVVFYSVASYALFFFFLTFLWVNLKQENL